MARRRDFSDVRLYAVTDPVTDPERTFKITEMLLEGGVDAIQLRSRELSDRLLLQLAIRLKELCGRHEALFLMDNRVDIACLSEADGVHLGHEDLPLSEARKLLGHGKIIGASAHSVPQALSAQRDGADYVSCGPLWATPTKPQYPAVGLGLIGLYRAALRIPFVAIGGINETNVDEVVMAGADRIAVVRGLYGAADPLNAAKKFRQTLNVAGAPSR